MTTVLSEVPPLTEFGKIPFSEAWYETLCDRLGETFCQNLGIYAIPADFLLSVVMPVYNEASTLELVLRRVCRVPVRKEIIVVDDASRDGTRDILRR